MRIHSFTDDILGDLDATGIAELVKNKELQAKEVVAATIKRAQKVNPEINAIVTDCFEKALATAEQHAGGFFSGVPIFFKDLALIEGLPNYYGTAAFEGAKPAKKNDPIVEQILAQGFVNLGTSTMPELGLTCSTEFADASPTRNPWDPEYSVGGSSGGSAALVAAGVVPLAHSADGGGSTRIPAACCGAVGLKPSRGRILLSKMFAKQLVDIAIDGVITRTVRDTAHFYGEAEKYYHNKKLPKMGTVTSPLKRSLTIGFTGKAAQGYGADAKMSAHLNEAVKILENLGHTVKEVELPITDQLMEDFKYLWGMSAYLVKKFGKSAIQAPFDPTKLSKLTDGLANFYRKNIFKTPSFIRRLRRTNRLHDEFFKSNKIDVLLTPTLTHGTPKHGYIDMAEDFDVVFPRMEKWACITPFCNTTGAPSISLPLLHDKENDLPVGILFSANHGQDALLLELAYQLEEAVGWEKIY